MMRNSPGRVDVLAALALMLSLPAAAQSDRTAEPDPTVWLIGRAARPSVVRYLRAQLAELDVEVRTARRRVDAPGPYLVTLERRAAHITHRDGDELTLLRTITLPRGLDTTGRARLTHALRTLLE